METHTVNVTDAERWITGIGGAAMAVAGMRQRSGSGLLMVAGGGALLVRAATGYCPAYGALGINSTETRRALGGRRGMHVNESITIQRPAAELYDRWRQLARLPEIMSHLVSVTETGQTRSHWVAKAPFGSTVEWDAEMISDDPGSLISWRTVEESDVVSAGSVKFVPDARGGTIVHVKLQYSPPAGAAGAAVAWLTGRSGAQSVRDDLRRFKALIEAGEVPTIEGQPRGVTSILNYD